MLEYAVRVVKCDHRSSDEEVYNALCRATLPLKRSWDKLAKARKILIKANIVWPQENIAFHEGRYRELVDPVVLKCVLRLIKERTNAELILADTRFSTDKDNELYFKPLLAEMGVKFIDASQPPLQYYDVPGGGIIFGRYLFTSQLAEADAVVSVAKLKSHLFTGITLSTKNLFGLSPLPPLGRSRSYYHHLVRLPHVIADLGKLFNPCLNIIDGLVGQSGREWGGDGRIGDVLIAGDHVIATDVVGAHYMGNDPNLDWPQPPFRRERNYIKVAVENGFGTADLSNIDIQSEVEAPVAQFTSASTDPWGMVRNWHKTACEQGLYYRDHRKEMIERYKGEYIYLQMNNVVWHGKDPTNLGSRRVLSGKHKDQALWLKFVDPEEMEKENFLVYENELKSERGWR